MEDERRLDVELPIFRSRRFLHKGSYAEVSWVLSLLEVLRALYRSYAVQRRSNGKQLYTHGRRSAETARKVEVYTVYQWVNGNG